MSALRHEKPMQKQTCTRAQEIRNWHVVHEFLKKIKENGINFIEKNIDVLNKSNVDDKKIISDINRFIKKYRENDDENDNKQF